MRRLLFRWSKMDEFRMIRIGLIGEEVGCKSKHCYLEFICPNLKVRLCVSTFISALSELAIYRLYMTH